LLAAILLVVRTDDIGKVGGLPESTALGCNAWSGFHASDGLVASFLI